MRESIRGVQPGTTIKNGRTDVPIRIVVLTSNAVIGTDIQVHHELVNGRLESAWKRIPRWAPEDREDLLEMLNRTTVVRHVSERSVSYHSSTRGVSFHR